MADLKFTLGDTSKSKSLTKEKKIKATIVLTEKAKKRKVDENDWTIVNELLTDCKLVCTDNMILERNSDLDIRRYKMFKSAVEAQKNFKLLQEELSQKTLNF